MFVNHKLLIITLSVFMLPSLALADDNAAEKYGIEKQRTDTVNTRTDTYKKELGKSESGKGYGVYASSTTEYKNDGERDTSANEKEGAGSKGVGVYIEF